MAQTIRIFDTTLRDGEQAPGCSMDLHEKIEVAKQLERLNVDVIEAGFAISSVGDFESVRAIAQTVKNVTVASLARAVEKDIDRAYEAVRHAESPLIHTFISTSSLHMEYKLKMKPESVLERAEQMVRYARSLCPDVEFSAEDATRSDPDFLARIFEAVIKAGATIINIPDTVGYATPGEMAQLVRYVRQHVKGIEKAVISVHCHNDLGLGVANSLASIGEGATQIECTVNGLGERAGNAALEEVVMAMHTRRDLYGADCRIVTNEISRTSKLVYAAVGMMAPRNKAVVGANAFAHEAGIHQHGVMANRATYEIMLPASIGLQTSALVLGKHSGKHAFEQRVAELGFRLSPEEIQRHFEAFKALCDRKKEVHDGDIEALIRDSSAVEDGYKLVRFDMHAASESRGSCTVRLQKDGVDMEDVALGNGPVDAAYNAIDKMVGIAEYELFDYAIRSVTEGTDALGEVVVKLKYGDELVTGRGLSTDVMEASILAYLSGVNRLISMRGNNEIA
jgi:2-isopropylmalate synthase